MTMNIKLPLTIIVYEASYQLLHGKCVHVSSERL